MSIQTADAGKGLQPAYTISSSGILSNDKKRYKTIPGFDWSKDPKEITKSYTIKSIKSDAYRGEFRDSIYFVLPKIPVHKSFIELTDNNTILWTKPESDVEVVYFDNKYSFDLHKSLKNLTDEDIETFKQLDWIGSYDDEIYKDCSLRIDSTYDDHLSKFADTYYVMKYGEQKEGVFKAHECSGMNFNDDIKDYILDMRNRLEKVYICNDLSQLEKHIDKNSFLFVSKNFKDFDYDNKDLSIMTLFNVDGYDRIEYGSESICKNYELGDNELEVTDSVCVGKVYKDEDSIIFQDNDYIYKVDNNIEQVLDIENEQEHSVETKCLKIHKSFIENSYSDSIGYAIIGVNNDDEMELFIEQEQCNKFILKNVDGKYTFSLAKNQSPKNKNDQLVSILKKIDYPFIKEYENNELKIYKSEELNEERIIYGVVMEPDEVDAHGDYTTKEDIRKACYKYMEDYKGELGLFHKMKSDSLKLLENYISLTDMKKYSIKEGSWIMAVRVNDDHIWERIKLGEKNPDDPKAITGFSIQGYAVKTTEKI